MCASQPHQEVCGATRVVMVVYCQDFAIPKGILLVVLGTVRHIQTAILLTVCSRLCNEWRDSAWTQPQSLSSGLDHSGDVSLISSIRKTSTDGSLSRVRLWRLIATVLLHRYTRCCLLKTICGQLVNPPIIIHLGKDGLPRCMLCWHLLTGAARTSGEAGVRLAICKSLLSQSSLKIMGLQG